MLYGISELSVIPIRKEANDKSEMINQILFGEHFKIFKKDKKWSKISLSHDGYEGWICNKQWTEIKKETYNKIEKETTKITTDIIQSIKKKEPQPIVIGSILPFYKNGYIIIEDKKYKFNGSFSSGSNKRKKIIENSLIYLNAPYLWGGRSPFGIDCSGLTQMVYRLQGIRIPRDAYQQAEIGKTVNKLEESCLGDLAFFENNNNQVTHVGIILNKNKIIHASGKVRIDKIDKKGIFNIDTNKYTHKLKLIKQII
tara:strand:+ start:6269 stop:7033 length:765 start_codon:yes stop_codon:yes gene_type:complete